MPWPVMIDRLPEADLPFPPEVVIGRILRAPEGLTAFFTFHQPMTLPPHSHGAQWGVVVEGEIAMTIGSETRVCRAGDSYDIPAGVEHGAKIAAGTRVIDVFEEPDRYAARG